MPVIWKTIDGASVNAEAPPSHCRDADNSVAGGLPVVRVILRPNRSLSRRGFAWVLLISWGLLLVPLTPLLGTTALWVMLPFLLAVLAALWISIERSYRDGRLYEELTLRPDLICVQRHNPRGAPQYWEASPFWTKLRLRPEGGPVENYITLKGNGREIELGAFLSPDERTELFHRLEVALSKARQPVFPER